jgi:hypothetical protein
MRLTPCRKPDRRFAEPLLPSGLGFASRGGLQQAQTLATDLFRTAANRFFTRSPYRGNLRETAESQGLKSMRQKTTVFR